MSLKRVFIFIFLLCFSTLMVAGCSQTSDGTGSPSIDGGNTGGGNTDGDAGGGDTGGGDTGGGDTGDGDTGGGDTGGGDTGDGDTGGGDTGGGDIGDAGSDIKWEGLPEDTIVSDDRIFDYSDMPELGNNDKVSPTNPLSLIGTYRIAYISVENPDGKKIINNIVGSGDNMRGEFAVGATSCSPSMGISCPVGLAIAMNIKFQFHENIINKGLPESLHFVRQSVYKAISSITDINGEFKKLGAEVIVDPNNPENYVVNFTMSNPDLPIPKNYKIILTLAKYESGALLESPRELDSNKYFSDSGDVESVTLAPAIATVVAGETLQLNTTITPVNAAIKTIVYTSSDTSVATVDDKGLVTAISEGEVTITATSVNGKTAESVITVEAAQIPIASITFDKTNVSLDLNTADPTLRSKTLTLTILPADATDNEVTFTSSHPTIVNIGKQTAKDNKIEVTINALQESNSVTITAETANGKKAVCFVEVVNTTIHVTSITLNKTSAELDINDTLQLTTTVEPNNATNKNITYSSSDISVATVHETTGLVTAISVGTATVTVTSIDGSKTALCEITVKRPVVNVTSISVMASTTIEENETYNLGNTLSVTPSNATDKSVTYESSDTSIATVDNNGIVTAVSAGSATITVKANDTTNNVTATCTITVSAYVPPKVDVTGISITNKITSLKKGVNTTSLTVEVTPTNATTQTYRFDSSNTDVATVDNNGLITALKEGTTTIKVTSHDNANITDTMTVIIWDSHDLSGTYSIKSLKIAMNDGTEIASSQVLRQQLAKGYFVIEQMSAGTLQLSGKFQIIDPVMYNNAPTDKFRYVHFTQKKENLTEQDTSIDGLKNLGLTMNSDGTLTYVFNADTETATDHSDATVTLVLNDTPDDDKTAVQDERMFVTEISKDDPKSLEGTYRITNFTSYSVALSFIKVYVGTMVNNNNYKNSVQRMLGTAAINMDIVDKKANIVSKIQMNSTALDKETAGIDTRNQQFQLTEYNQQDYTGIENNQFGNIGSTTEADKKNGVVVITNTKELVIKQKFKQSIATVEVNTYIIKESDKYIMDTNQVMWCYTQDDTTNKISYIKNHYDSLACPTEEPTDGYINWN